jgi:small nuclear ribonucleoprotein (snRNP)-like protein
MLKNAKSLKDFYGQVVAVDNIFNTVLKNNAVLEDKYYEKNPKNIEEKKQETNVISPEQKYILHYVKSPGYKVIIGDIFADMEKYKFSTTSSIPHHAKNKNTENTTYAILDKIKLDKHTINSVVCCIEICENEELPQAVLENGVLLCLLHDFGKEKRIASEYGENKAESHNIISAHYFQKKFKKYIDTYISKDTYLALTNTLEEHHNRGASETLLLNLLRKADREAREKEEVFILSRDVQNTDSEENTQDTDAEESTNAEENA